MERTAQSVLTGNRAEVGGAGLFSSESVLDTLRLILAGSPLPEVLEIIAQLVESRGDGTLCTIWLPVDDGKQIYCVAAPSLPGFEAGVGSMQIGPKGGSCGAAMYLREPVYVDDILVDPIWDHYRHLLVPYGIRAVWSRPLFTHEGQPLGTFAVHYRAVRSPDAADLQLIESASAGLRKSDQGSRQRDDPKTLSRSRNSRRVWGHRRR